MDPATIFGVYDTNIIFENDERGQLFNCLNSIFY